MTRTTNARTAGFTFLVYIAVALSAMILSSRAAAGEGSAAKLASIAQHVLQMRLAIVFDLLSGFCALVLAVTLYAITRDQDPELAMLGLTFRLGEGLVGAASLPRAIGRLWLATGPDRPDPAAAAALEAFLVKLPSWSSGLSATFFAVGSTLFAYLFLRGRIVPVSLAWLGLLASILVVVSLPLQLVGVLTGPFTDLMWLPMIAYELWLALWLIFKGAAVPRGQA